MLKHWLCAVALTSALLAVTRPVAAQPATGSIADFQPAAVLVMPFDVTEGHTSFMIVSRGGDTLARRAVATHWVFYSADCSHLADLEMVLTENDTVVVDLTHIQSQKQQPGELVNDTFGPIVDLTGARGVAIVSVQPQPGVPNAQLIGSWTIADRRVGTAFGSNAVGFTSFALPDPTPLETEGLVIPTFDPSTLDISQVIVIGLEQQGDSIVPISRPSEGLDGAHVCCNAAITDTLETVASVPDVCFACALFAPVAPTRVPSPDPPVVPAASPPASAGTIVLRACRSEGNARSPAPLGSGRYPQYIVAFHGQAVGPFGVATSGKFAAPQVP